MEDSKNWELDDLRAAEYSKYKYLKPNLNEIEQVDPSSVPVLRSVFERFLPDPESVFYREPKGDA